MTSDATCWICTTPPGRLNHALLETPCRCGHPLRYHALGAPHGFAVRDCPKFESVMPIKRHMGAAEAQLLLLSKGA
jgi:hypothetical protein